MGSLDDKLCNQDLYKASIITPTKKTINSRFKPTPSKWDDAQKWLVGLSNASNHTYASKTHARNSNAEDLRLLTSNSMKGRDSCSSIDGLSIPVPNEGDTKNIDNWTSKSIDDVSIGVRSVSLRDMGTEMTPIASKEPSRVSTPIRARSPTSSKVITSPKKTNVVKDEPFSRSVVVSKSTSLECKAMAWDEAEKTKYMARYKREEVKIQAWENRKTRKAEMEMKRIEAKAERMKSRAQEKLAKKIMYAKRKAEERRSNAEAKLDEQAAKASEQAEYIRKAGHLHSSFISFKLPSLCH